MCVIDGLTEDNGFKLWLCENGGQMFLKTKQIYQSNDRQFILDHLYD